MKLFQSISGRCEDSYKARFFRDFLFRAPGTGALLWEKVPLQVDHSERSEAQLHEGDRMWGGSVERHCEPMEKNRIEGVAEQGERAQFCEALVINVNSGPS